MDKNNRYKRFAGIVWHTRLKAPYTSVSIERDGQVKAIHFREQGKLGWGWVISRSEARLLAKRINAALEYTGR